MSVAVEEGCPPLLRADSFEFNDLLSDSQADPDDPEEGEVVGDVISLDAVSIEQLSEDTPFEAEKQKLQKPDHLNGESTIIYYLLI